LLYLYEIHPQIFTDNQLNIPESDNGSPDLLDEVRWALGWLMKMQNDEGGVFHKVSQKHWVGEFLPQNDPEVRYIFEVTTNSTAAFTAVAALGAQLFAPFETDFADQLAKAAFRGWQYLQEHPEIQPSGGFENPPGVTGGEYADDHDEDVRLWAAIELYKLTQDEKYLEYFTRTLADYKINNLPPLSWKNFEALGLSAFLKADLPPEYQEEQQQIYKLFTEQAKRLLKLHKANNYRHLLKPNEFYWGSNSVNLAYAFVLIQLYEQTGNQQYYKAALDQLHYTLGRNPLDVSYVTGIGNSSVQNPYHQFSEKLGAEKPVPGMLVGGPNNHLDLRGHDISDYPAKSYEDRFKNYLVNEPAINYTAIFAYVAGYFASPQKEFFTEQ
jgi:endoglucanase